MPREQLALKFPKGTKLRIQAVALPGESMTATILRALDGLEAAPQTPDIAPDSFEGTPDIIGLPSRVDALEQRIAALEGSRRDLNSTEPYLDDSSHHPDSPGPDLDESRSNLDPSESPVLAWGREAVINRIKDMRAKGVTNKTIAETLNKGRIPTFSGRGQWQAGTVSRITREQ